MAKRQCDIICDVYLDRRKINIWAQDAVLERVRLMPEIKHLEPSLLSPSAENVAYHTAYVDPRYNIEEVAREIVEMADGRTNSIWLGLVARAIGAAS